MRSHNQVDRHTDGLLSIFRSFKDNSSGSLGSSVGSDIDIGSNDVASSAEQVFQILPTCLIRKLYPSIRTASTKVELTRKNSRYQRIADYQDCFERNSCVKAASEVGQRSIPGPPLPYQSYQGQASRRNVPHSRDPRQQKGEGAQKTFQNRGNPHKRHTSRMKTGRPSRGCSESSRMARCESS